MRSFEDIYALACSHVGGKQKLESSLPRALDDAFFLSNIVRPIFRAGLKHAMVDAKWPDFERVFHNFDPFFCAMLSEDDSDLLMKDKSIIRHRGKFLSVRHNAKFFRDVSQEAGQGGV